MNNAHVRDKAAPAAEEKLRLPEADGVQPGSRTVSFDEEGRRKMWTACCDTGFFHAAISRSDALPLSPPHPRPSRLISYDFRS